MQFLPVSKLIFCLRLASKRMSMTRWVNSLASRVANFCRAWFLIGDKEGLTGRNGTELCICCVVSQTEGEEDEENVTQEGMAH